jgi:hypothetical protein
MSQSCGYMPSPQMYFRRSESHLESLASSAITYSKREATPAHSYSFHSDFKPQRAYSSDLSSTLKAYSRSSLAYQITHTEKNYHFIPDNFLVPEKLGMFVGKAEEVKEFVESAFELMFHKSFPKDIKVSILDSEQFHKLAPHAGTVGLSINRRQFGLMSEIFIKNDFLGRVMLTIGHELGHVLTPTLDNKHDEEAKAYAFSLAWIKAIKQNDIAGLRSAIITETPAHNGLHNVAFNFVEKMIRSGKESWDVYLDVIGKNVSCNLTA